MWENHLGAVITGIAAVGAAAVTAVFSAWAIRDAASEGTDRASARQEADARGAARVLLSEFLIAGNEISDWAGNGTWEPFGPEYPIDIDRSDLRLIASHISPKAWIWVQAGLSDVTELRRYVAQRASRKSRFRGYLLSRYALHIAARDLDSIGRASRSLRDLAGLKETPYRTLHVPASLANLRRISRQTGVPIAPD